jgi:uncharacterized protein (DUF885 family)
VTTFADRIDTFLAEYFRLHPLRATDAGAHEHDGRWPDLTETGRLERLAFLDRWTAELTALDEAELDLDSRVDRDLLLGELAAHRFGETRLREDRWDALSWVYLMGEGLFPLLAREYAPLADRLAASAMRIEGLPAVVVAAIDSLTGSDGRPVARLHAETAIGRLAGVVELVDDAVREAEAHAEEPAVAALLPRLRMAAETARGALARFEAHLRDVVLPASEGDGRLGTELFAEKLRYTLASDELTPERVLAAAERDYRAVRAEMVRLAHDLWPVWLPGEPLPTAASEGTSAAAEGRLVRGVLDAIATQHQRPDDLLDFCGDELGRIEAFCRSQDVVGLADEPLEIRWTPLFLRAFGGAMLIPPGPLDRGQKSFFAITPPAEDWSPEQVESSLRENNDRMLRVLTIHEAVPGHYLQLAYSNRCPSVVRSIFWSGVYAEGWAVYVTQVMMDLGYGAEDPALLLVHWKYYLRAAINAIIDVRIHGHGMTEDEAVALMVEGGFQEDAEARNKYLRARLSSTQLSTYFIGSMQLWDLERERRRRLAAASDGGPAAPAVDGAAAELPGGLGSTPGFTYREHLETVLGHGSPPIPLLRRILLDGA